MCVFHIKISIKVIFYYLYCRSCPTVLDTTVWRLLPFFICSSWALNKIHIIFKVENICTSLVVQLEFSIFHRNFFSLSIQNPWQRWVFPFLCVITEDFSLSNHFLLLRKKPPRIPA